jgi:GntR family transcriptional repressor for pyruvate dehydrogenase complex
MPADESAVELFRAVPREATLANRVTGEIERLIIAGRLRAGARLPSERELSEQFGVSRTVVREAVRGLAARGLLEVRPGSGTTIRSPSAESIARSMTLFLCAGQPDLDYARVHEIRRVLEIEIAGLAAGRRTDDDLARLDAILGEMATVPLDRDGFARNDVAFHSALAAATQNPLFPMLLDSIVETMLQVRRMGFDVPGAVPNALRFHRAIYEQVRAGDPTGAREAMRVHLLDSEEVVRQALALHASRGGAVMTR